MEVQSLMLKKYTSNQVVRNRVYRQNIIQHSEQENFDTVTTSTQLKTTHGRTSPSGNGKTSPNTSSTSINDPYLIDKLEWANLTRNTKDKINAMRLKIKDLTSSHANIHLQTFEESNQVVSNVETQSLTGVTEQQHHFGPFQDTVRQFILRANGQQHVVRSTLSSHHILRQVITLKYGRLISDSGADTSALSDTYAHLLATHDMEISIDGCHPDKPEIYKLCDGVVAVDIGNDTYLLGLRSIPLIPKSVGLLMSELQVRANGVQVDSQPKCFGGKGLIIIEDVHIPLHLQRGLMNCPIRKPSEQDLEILPIYWLNQDQTWNPSVYDECLSTSTLLPRGYTEKSNEIFITKSMAKTLNPN